MTQPRERYTKEQLITKLKAARLRATAWVGEITEAYYYIVPGRNAISEFYKYLRVTPPIFSQIYDLTATVSTLQRANQLVSMLMPDRQRWGTLQLNPKAMSRLTPQMVQDAQDTLYYYLGNSNLAANSRPMFVDETMGSGALWIDDPSDEVPLSYKALPGYCIMPEYYNGEEVKDYWYPFGVSAQYIIDTYENIDPYVLSYIKDSADKTPSSVFFISRGLIFDPLDGEDYRVVDILEDMGTGKDFNASILSDTQSYYKKLVYVRDEVRPGDNIGYGPGLSFLPLVKRLNKLCALRYESNKIRGLPPIEMDMTQFSLRSGYSGNALSGKVLAPKTFGNFLELPSAPSVDEEIQSLRDDIQIAFSINPLGTLEQPVRTATEVSARLDVSRLNTIINASRLLNECSKPIFENTLYILLKRGLIPQSELILQEMKKNKKALILSYRNPLADIQNNNDVVSLQRTLQTEQQFLGDAAIPASFNLQELQQFFIDTSNLRVTLFNPPQDFENKILNGLQGEASNQPENGGEMGQGSPQPTPTTVGQPVQPFTLQGVNI